MKVYVAGKITGTSDYEKKFADRAFQLKRMGYDVVNPVPLIKFRTEVAGRELSHDECMKFCLDWLNDCDGINLLPDWKDSEGAREEYDFAVSHGKSIVDIKFFK
ncbi:MAG: DUF4406 domain-containing protein [Lachnospiraceae bacterium]|nr:DUF4406 domain-containing protein [Lachnospiraceae bacterium]